MEPSIEPSPGGYLLSTARCGVPRKVTLRRTPEMPQSPRSPDEKDRELGSPVNCKTVLEVFAPSSKINSSGRGVPSTVKFPRDNHTVVVIFCFAGTFAVFGMIDTPAGGLAPNLIVPETGVSRPNSVTFTGNTLSPASARSSFTWGTSVAESFNPSNIPRNGMDSVQLNLGPGPLTFSVAFFCPAISLPNLKCGWK